jgi:NADH kinase
MMMGGRYKLCRRLLSNKATFDQCKTTLNSGRNNHETYFKWPDAHPRNILVVSKKRDQQTMRVIGDMSKHLRSEYPGVNVIFEQAIQDLVKDHHVRVLPLENSCDKHALTSDVSSTTGISRRNDDGLMDMIDLVVGVGGDGTLLHVSSLFPKRVPPVVPFSMGTLGFLMPFGTYIEQILVELHIDDFNF